jgi:ribosomal protein L30
MGKKLNETAAKVGARVTVRQYRSAAGYDKRTKAVLCALGLGRIGKERVLAASPALLGQVARVSHLVTVTNA